MLEFYGNKRLIKGVNPECMGRMTCASLSIFTKTKHNETKQKQQQTIKNVFV